MADVLIPAFDRATVSRPWLGAQLIDTGVEAGPFVVDVTSGGPAEVAGLRAGDVLVGIEGTEVRRAAEVETVLTDVPLEGSISLAFTRDGVARQAQLTRRDSPAVVPVGDPSVAHAAVSARLHATLDRERSGQPTWVWELNDATTRLAVGDLEGAIEILRRVERAAPDRPGVGRATVYYWLGVAYAAAGPEFSDQARRNLEWASEIADGRLGHDDGPWVTPRARARLARLAGR